MKIGDLRHGAATVGVICAMLQPAFGAGITAIETTVENRTDTSGDYNDPNNNIRYEFNSGTQNSIFLNGFTAGGDTYELFENGLDVSVRRSSSTDDFESLAYVHKGTRQENGRTVYEIIGNRTYTAEDAFGGNDLSDGVENVFQNVGSLAKTIERIDYVFADGFRANNASQLDVGFTFFERDGNNQFTVAAITDVDINGNPTEFGDLIRFGQNTVDPFGPDITNYDAYTEPFNSVTVDGNFTGNNPSDSQYDFTFANSQKLGGVYLSFADLGIVVDEVTYGYALFGADNDISITNVPTDVSDPWYLKNTSSSLAAGGDLYFGGVLFNNTDINFDDDPIILTPNFYWDRNGDTPGAGGSGSAINGTWSNDLVDSNWGNVDGDVDTGAWVDNKIAHFSAGTDAGATTAFATIEVDGTIETKGLRFEDGRTRLQDTNATAGEISLNGTGVSIDVAGTNNARGDIRVSLTGTDGLIKTGDGRLDLRGNNTYTGLTDIQDGQVRLFGGNVIGDDQRINVASGAQLRIQADEEVGSITGGGTINLTNDDFTVGSDNTSTTFSGNITNNNAGNSLNKVGSGTLTLSGNNTYGGSTTVSGGGVLELAGTGGNQALQNTSDISVTGGTLLLSTANQIANDADLSLDNALFSLQDNDETLGTLTLTSTSTIDMGVNSGPGAILTFSDTVSSGTYLAGTLVIDNWDGIPDTGNGNNQIIFASSLSQNFLDNVFWSDLNRVGAKQLPTGEIVPFSVIPEPSTYIGGGFLTIVIAFHFWRRRKARQAEEAAQAA